jgi:hypothetical protein
MITETLLVPVISGACVILSACTERLMNFICPEIRKEIINLCFKNKNENTEQFGDISYNEIDINSPATCVLKILWEEPNIGKNQYKYTSIVNNDQYYNIEIPPVLNNACVNVYQEYLKVSDTGIYYLAVKLSNVNNNNNNVKLFIKRFREKNLINKEWVPSSFKPVEYIEGKNGINIFTAKSLIGIHDVLFEQLGVMVESNTESYSNCIIERAYLENKPML